MQIHMLGLLLIFQSFNSCQQSPEAALFSECKPVSPAGILVSQHLEMSNSATTDLVFRSLDGGMSWQDMSAGLPKNLSVGRVHAEGGEIFLTTENALYHSNASASVPVWENEVFFDLKISGISSGQTGAYISSYEHGLFKKIAGTSVLIPLHHNLEDKTVRTFLETPSGTLFVGCESGIFKSSDEGNSWKKVFSETGINSFVEAGGVLVCGTYKGLLRSTDDGEHWDWVLTEDGSAWKTTYMGGRFVTITEGGDWKDNPANRLRMSADGGKTWQRMDEGLRSTQFIFNREVDPSPIESMNDVKMAGKYLFCSTNVGVFRSSDWGKNWEPVFTESGFKLLQLAVFGDVIYAVKVIGC